MLPRMSKRKVSPKSNGSARHASGGRASGDRASGGRSSGSRASGSRARDLAGIARTLDERKRDLAYGEFERWALKAYPQYPIQVLRYLRKAHRIFGKDLPRLLERFGQKKVFLLVGLDDPWAPIQDGISPGDSGEKTPLEQFSVSQLREVIRRQNGMESRGRNGWGSIDSTLGRIATLWPRVQKASPHATLRRESARRQFDRFRALLREALGQLDAVLGAADPALEPARVPVPRAAPTPAAPTPAAGKQAAARSSVKPRDPSFLD